jgi:hypothetical protein
MEKKRRQHKQMVGHKFCPEALAFYLGVFDLSIMRLIIFVFKQESSKKRFIFFSNYPNKECKKYGWKENDVYIMKYAHVIV